MDLWHWRAILDDGSTFDEYEGGVSHGFREIPLDRCIAIQLIPTRPSLPTPHVVCGGDVRPVFFRRRTHTASLTSGVESQPVQTITVLGWQQLVGGINVQALVGFWPDGSIALVTDQAVIR